MVPQRQTNRRSIYLVASGALAASCLLCLLVQQAEAGQGCPFDDGSCNDYCAQQGCSLGYCGHFAWIQCICRKCGDEWNSYDKIRYKPDQKVNQTELESLNLNSSAPIILTNNQQQNNNRNEPQPSSEPNNKQLDKNAQKSQPQQATLTTLLIPDLGETSGKIDPNEVPDENSDKFLDYLAKNHERLVQATRQESGGSEESSESGAATTELDEGVTTEETVEIQVKSNPNEPEDQASQTAADSALASSQTGQQTTSTTRQEVRKTTEGLMKLLRLAFQQHDD